MGDSQTCCFRRACWSLLWCFLALGMVGCEAVYNHDNTKEVDGVRVDVDGVPITGPWRWESDTGLVVVEEGQYVQGLKEGEFCSTDTVGWRKCQTWFGGEVVGPRHHFYRDTLHSRVDYVNGQWSQAVKYNRLGEVETHYRYTNGFESSLWCDHQPYGWATRFRFSLEPFSSRLKDTVRVEMDRRPDSWDTLRVQVQFRDGESVTCQWGEDGRRSLAVYRDSLGTVKKYVNYRVGEVCWFQPQSSLARDSHRMAWVHYPMTIGGSIFDRGSYWYPKFQRPDTMSLGRLDMVGDNRNRVYRDGRLYGIEVHPSWSFLERRILRSEPGESSRLQWNQQDSKGFNWSGAWEVRTTNVSCADGEFYRNLFDDEAMNQGEDWALYGYYYQGKSFEEWEAFYERCVGCSDVSHSAFGTWRGTVMQAYRFPDGQELRERWNEEVTFVPLGPRGTLIGEARTKKVAVVPADECRRVSGVPCPPDGAPQTRSALNWFQTPVIDVDSWDGEKYLASVYSNDAERRSDFFVYLEDKVMSYSYSVRIDEEGDRVSYDVVMERVFPTEDQMANSIQEEVSESLQWNGNGSGLLLTSSGLLVTCAHVVDQVSSIEVDFLDHGKWDSKNASIVKVDRAHDVALLQLEEMDGPLETPFRFSMDASTAEVGERVFAYGFPLALGAMGKELKVTDGIINANSGFEGDVTSFQLSAAIQPGSSGGPVFSEDGQFLGLAKGGLSKNVSDNVGYAVKAKYVLDCLAMLPVEIDCPDSRELEGKPLVTQVDAVRQAVVLVKVQ